MKIKMTRDLLENTNQIKKDAVALYEMGICGVEWGFPEKALKYFDDNYEYEMIESGSCWGCEVMTEEQLGIYNEYTDKVRYELYKMLRSESHE